MDIDKGPEPEAVIPSAHSKLLFSEHHSRSQRDLLSKSASFSTSFKSPSRALNSNEQIGIINRESSAPTTQSQMYHLHPQVAHFLSQESPLIAALACLLLKNRFEIDGHLLDYGLDIIYRQYPVLGRWAAQRMNLLKDVVDMFYKIEQNLQPTSQLHGAEYQSIHDLEKTSQDEELIFGIEHEVDRCNEQQSVVEDDDHDPDSEIESLSTQTEDSRNETPLSQRNDGRTASFLSLVSSIDGSESESAFHSFGAVQLPDSIPKQEVSKHLRLLNLLDSDHDEDFYSSIISRFIESGDVQYALLFAERSLQHGGSRDRGMFLICCIKMRVNCVHKITHSWLRYSLYFSL